MSVKKITLYEVAAATGVSVVTASAAFSGNGRVSDRKAQEIRRVAAELGYRPNAAARILKSKQVTDIGLVILEQKSIVHENMGMLDLMINFMAECRRKSLRFQVEWFDSINQPDDLPDMFTNGLVGGVVIYGCAANAAGRYLQETLALPHVMVTEPGTYSVHMNIAEGVRQLVACLAGQGKRRLALVNGPRQFHLFREARASFDAAAAEFGIPAEQLSYFSTHPHGPVAFDEDIIAIADRLLAQRPLPDAFIGHGDLEVKSLICELEKRGVHVPSMISAAGFDVFAAEKFSVPLTCVENDYGAVASRAVGMLQELMQGIVPRSNNITVPARLVIRKSTQGMK